MKRLTVIGAGGVGKAHAIAALNLGWGIALVVDSNPEVLDYYQKRDTIVNNWGMFCESASYPDESRPVVALSVMDAEPLWGSYTEDDVIVIATPDATHNELVNYVHSRVPSSTKILVEKPYKSTLVAPNIFVSAEWLYHDLVGLKAPIQDIGFCHSFHVEGSSVDIVGDLGFHLLSILYQSLGDALLKSFKGCQRTGQRNNPDMYCSVRLDFDDPIKDTVGLKLAYNPLTQNLKSFLGLPSTHSSEIKICYPNGVVALDWQHDLFESQYKNLVAGTHPITSLVATQIDTILHAIRWAA